MKKQTLLILSLLLIYSCSNQTPKIVTSVEHIPQWSKEAIWYQIFVERFRNGDPENDPIRKSLTGSWPHQFPENWAVTPWGNDWYKPDDWASQNPYNFYLNVQQRRYGGDLQGVIDKLDYLENLGITAIYLNPVNDAPSLHKYDARNYHHVDIHFGPDPTGDLKIISAENPEDPNTWKWTSADFLFLELIKQVHQRGMKLILDYSWNHTGIEFWAWKDILKYQEQSKYAGWYEIENFDDPTTPQNEFEYAGWAGVPELPELKKIDVDNRIHGLPYEGNMHPEVKKHIFAVAKRWLDPNGDGNPEDGIDGFRLDVAEQVPLGFWRDFRVHVRSINPDALLVGEIWWEKWPEKMIDPSPYLQGDIFDSIMNYRWYMPTRSRMLNIPPVETTKSYILHLDSISKGFPEEHLYAMMNLTASHDSPRFSTSMQNPGRYKHLVTPRETPEYNLKRANNATILNQQLVLVQQFTYVGAPMIWNGDEMGMWGADDPDNRKPLLWEDITFERETHHPFLENFENRPVYANRNLTEFYSKLIDLRKTRKELQTGSIEFFEHETLVSYQRKLSHAQALIFINPSESAAEQIVASEFLADKTYTDYFSKKIVEIEPGQKLSVELAPKSFRILLSKRN